MSEKKTASLDAVLRELSDERPEFELFGRVWTLQREYPAMLALRFQADLENPERQVGLNENIQLLSSLMDPPSQVDELLALGLSATTFSRILQFAIGVYSGGDPEEIIELMVKQEQAAKLGKTDVSLGKATPSSRTGRGSKRTSVPSTE